jgi:DNA mismatch endonuclease, patch repair protein
MERILRETLPEGFRTTPQRSRQMSAVKGRGNRTTEQRFRAALVREGISGWKLAPKTVLGRPDFYFSGPRVAVFVDGCFWHGCRKCGHIPKSNQPFWDAKIQSTRIRDRRTTAQLRKQGIHVVRFWEHDLSLDLPDCIDRLMAAIKRISLLPCE